MAPETGPRSGTIGLTASVTGGTATGVRFTIGDSLSAPATSSDGGRAWTLRVDIGRLPDGTYPVVAVATNASGATVSSAPSTVIVDN